MINRVEYQVLKKAILEQNFTLQQVKILTKTQANQLVDFDFFNYTKFNGLKEVLIDTVRSRDEEAEMKQIEQTLIDAGIKATLPKIELTQEHQDQIRFIKIWPEGKPAK